MTDQSAPAPAPATFDQSKTAWRVRHRVIACSLIFIGLELIHAEVFQKTEAIQELVITTGHWAGLALISGFVFGHVYETIKMKE